MIYKFHFAHLINTGQVPVTYEALSRCLGVRGIAKHLLLNGLLDLTQLRSTGRLS